MNDLAPPNVSDASAAAVAMDPVTAARWLADLIDNGSRIDSHAAEALRACSDEIDQLRELARWVTDQLSPLATTAVVGMGGSRVTDPIPCRLGPTARRVWPDVMLAIEPSTEDRDQRVEIEVGRRVALRGELIGLIRHLYNDIAPTGGVLHVALDDLNVEDHWWHGGGNELRDYLERTDPARHADVSDEEWEVCGRIGTLMLSIDESVRAGIIREALDGR